MTINERLFLLLDEKKKRAADLCRVLNIGTNVTSGWKKHGTNPPAKYIVQIAEFLDVSTYYLLTGVDKLPTTDPDEIDMLLKYRALEPEQKQFFKDTLSIAYERATSKKDRT